jgi:hypothetical protein
MTESWVNSAERIGADLHLELSGPGGRRAGLTRALREAVRSGRLPPGTERSTVKAAAWQGVALDGLAAFLHPEAEPTAGDGLVVGYASPPEHAYGAALEALCGVLPPE